MAHAGVVRTDRQHLKKLIEECELEWKVLNKEVKRINRVREIPPIKYSKTFREIHLMIEYQRLKLLFRNIFTWAVKCAAVIHCF